MPDTKISALPAQTTGNGGELLACVDGGGNKKITVDQVRDFSHLIMQPAYKSLNWYAIHEDIPYSGASNGNVVAVTNILLYPFIIWQTVTITDLAACVTTGGTNMKLGIYASNATTKRPTGTCLKSTGNINVTSTGNVTGTLSGGSVTLQPGLYWIAMGSDNTALRLLGVGSSLSIAGFVNSTVGSATLANITGSANWQGYSVTEAAYGTFGDLTSASFNVSATANCAYFFKVA